MLYQYKSFAKLNLSLHIIGQNYDNYHLLQSVFQKIDLYDEISFSLRKDTKINFETNFQVKKQHNLIFKAIKLLQDYKHRYFGLDIHFKKNIPVGAGLGGGSSNAAITLQALNQIFDLSLNYEELQSLGLQLGADVPFFLFPENQAFIEGIGEKMQNITLPKFKFLIIYPNTHISTKIIFTNQDLKRNQKKVNKEQMLQEIINKQAINNCLPVVLENYKEVKEAYHFLQENFHNAFLTGTGACVFAYIDETQKIILDDIRTTLPQDWQIFLANSL